MTTWNESQKITNIETHSSWNKFFNNEFKKEYIGELEEFLKQEIEKFGEIREIYPPREQVFNAFNNCHFDKLKVVIIGQDPYINPGEAMGLSFSVPKGKKIPPSLKNIYLELYKDKEVEFSCLPKSGDLSSWAEQGILLLNASLTVRQSKSNSHYKYWQELTDNLIKFISNEKENVIFVLWGNFAKQKKQLINTINKHHILESAHPSPLSASRGGWFGNNHFSKINNILKNNNKEIINWHSII